MKKTVKSVSMQNWNIDKIKLVQSQVKVVNIDVTDIY